jgi:FtsP/CotA-like multicopper oxidase with cupredoxin domain
MRSLPIAVVAVVVVAFLAVGGYLVFARSGSSGGQAQTINATVAGTTMSPDKLIVHQGDRVTMSIKVDRKEEVHLHGYDIAFEGENAGDTVSKTFTADKTGHFEIEIEDTSTEIGSLEVQPR